jgi:hypothetical protein
MREIALKKSEQHENSCGEQEYFLIVRNYRQSICKNRRKILRKANDERKRIMQMIETEG